MVITKEHDMVDSVELEDKTSLDESTPALTSAFATWTRSQCVRKFWRLYLTGMSTSIAGM
jgi:hypothetical protein